MNKFLTRYFKKSTSTFFVLFLIVCFSVFSFDKSTLRAKRNNLLSSAEAGAAENNVRALKRAQYLLNGTIPTDEEFSENASSSDSYRATVRNFLNHPNFYDVVLRYHERVFGVGMPTEYLDELQRNDIDGKSLKLAKLKCRRANEGSRNAQVRFECNWEAGSSGKNKVGQCPKSQQEPVSPFWKKETVAWVCPSVTRACGSNLSKCFVEFENEEEAKNSELGTSEAFDSRFTIIKSLSKQAAGLATAVAVENYPYTKILEPGLTAVDGAIAHFMGQTNHFDIAKLSAPQDLINQLKKVNIDDTKFNLVYTGNSYQYAGVLTTFGWLRRYEKNRTRANQTYERLLCRRLTSDLPRVFPQDPGDLRSRAGCSGCHATLDPMADFFHNWGEGGELYDAGKGTKEGSFIGQTGVGPADLARIIVGDEAFPTCTVQNVYEWMMGRKFYKSEEELRNSLTQYFIRTKYSFKELVYAVATHPVFLQTTRSDSVVTDPLEAPPLGKVPDVTKKECPTTTSFADVSPYISQCTSCHASGTARQPLTTEAQWRTLGRTALGLMSSGSMPPGQAGPPAAGPVYDFKEALRCWVEDGLP